MSSPVVPAEDAAPVVPVVLSRPAGELLLQETQPGALPPALDAVDLLVVEALQEPPHHPLEGPAPLALAEIVELALLHSPQTELLEEVHPGVGLELRPVGRGVGLDVVALAAAVVVIWNNNNILSSVWLISVIPLSLKFIDLELIS